MDQKNIFFSFFKMLKIVTFNIIHSIYHPISAQEINCIQKTGLFNHIEHQQLDAIYKSLKLRKYRKGALIFSENDVPDALYIILSGAVRVFTYDSNREKIALARLSEEDYFGEQAIIGQNCKTRSASVEAIEDTTLIRINAKNILPLWEENKRLKTTLEKIGSAQAIHTLTATVQIYNDLKNIINQFEHHPIQTFQNGEIIFNAGDKSDNVYIIISGEVNLFLSQAGKINHLILHKGHLFGELGVLENKPRLATAKADKNLRLLMINGNYFKTVYQQYPELQRLLSILKQTYQLPLHGSVEQYIGNDKVIGSTITTVFKMENGKTVIAVRSLVQPLFSISVVNGMRDVHYHYEKGEISSQISIDNNRRITAIEVKGDWEDLPIACQYLLENDTVDQAILENFSSSGKIGNLQTDLICNCMLVYKSQLQNLIQQGLKDINALTKETGAGTVCGGCRYKILEILGENAWISAIMKKCIQHNPYINSYYIIPTSGSINEFQPGQCITLQVKIHNLWVERNYTLSNTNYNDEPMRITIKKEPKGLFTSWLFEQAPDEFEIKVTQPQGSFTLNRDERTPALCFAGGIGCTPFISYLKWVRAMNHRKRMHLLYCALNEKDFVFVDELQGITAILPSVTVTYRANEKSGLLSKDEIIKLTTSFPEADIYVCGPEGFKNLICKVLSEIKYNPKKIHYEIFFHAGSPIMVS